MKLYFFVFSVLISFSSYAYEENAFSKPVPYYNYVDSIESLLDVAVKRNGWKLSQNDEGYFYAEISHKNYMIKVALLTDNNSLTIDLLSAEKISCSRSCKVDMGAVQGWLLRLRKSISYEITLAVRDRALRDSFSDV